MATGKRHFVIPELRFLGDCYKYEIGEGTKHSFNGHFRACYQNYLITLGNKSWQYRKTLVRIAVEPHG
jgi:hypothetical protein